MDNTILTEWLKATDPWEHVSDILEAIVNVADAWYALIERGVVALETIAAGPGPPAP
jgi:hypothetical protein